MRNLVFLLDKGIDSEYIGNVPFSPLVLSDRLEYTVGSSETLA